jgi:type I restriction enzyme M protein
MILRGIKYQNFHIYNDDTLAKDNFEGKTFRIQVANPPYSAHIQRPDQMADDPRFNSYGKFAPKTKADLAFLQHMIYHMDDDGRIACLLPHGVLFRGSAEETIRRYMIEKLNVIDAIIGLPAKLFYGTGIPVCVIVCRKNRNGNSNNIMFIDASKDFTPGKNQNHLEKEHIEKIFIAYKNRKDVDKFAHVASMDEIRENGFNLNIPRYVDSSEDVPEVDLGEVKGNIDDINAEIEKVSAELKESFNLLGLDFPF